MQTQFVKTFARIIFSLVIAKYVNLRCIVKLFVTVNLEGHLFLTV